ncbi:MAG: hypothetical protein FJ033_08810 [Chloroflexi bacterium]|nr:hypothetical protein [Chloroflexota bacterium]
MTRMFNKSVLMLSRRRFLAGLAGVAVLAALGSGCAGTTTSPTAPSAAAGILPVARLEVADSATLMIETKAPNGAVPAALASYFLTIHDAEEASRVGDERFNAAPQMTGPFSPVELRPAELTVVERHDGYWGGASGLDRVEFRGVNDGNARLNAVLAGDVQVARQIPPQGVSQAKSAGLAVQSVGSAYVYHLFLNNRRPPFDDPAVRRAMSLAVDRQALVDRVLNGSGQVATGAFPRFSPNDTFPFEAARARALLEDAGWKAGPDGTRVNEDRRLAFTILTYPQRPDLGLLATAIQAMVREVGVAASITSTEDISTPVDKGEYDAAMYACKTAPSGDPGFALNLLYHSKGALNGQIGYRSAMLDATVETAKRHELAAQAQAILREESPILHLAIPNYHTALARKVGGYEIHPVEMDFLDRAMALA